MLCASLLLIVLGTSALGQNETVVPVTSSADTLLATSLKTLTSASSAAQDFLLSGSVVYAAGSIQETGTVTIRALRGGYSEYSLTLPSCTIGEVRLRGASGSVRGTRQDCFGQHEILSKNLAAEPYWFSPELLLNAYTHDREWQTQVQPVTLPDGTGVTRISLARQPKPADPIFEELKLQSATEIDIDPKSLLPIAMTHRQFGEDSRAKPVTIRLTYSNFQTFSGHEVPLHIQRYVNGTLNLDLNLSSVRINTGLVNSDFQIGRQR